jgi:hypothetical protein
MIHEGTNEIVCPYCGHEFMDSWELQEDGEMDCYECNKKFNYAINRSVDYSTSKISCKDEHIWEFESAFVKNETYKRNDKKWEWIKIPRNLWEFKEIFKCKECDDRNYVNITEEEFRTKYPEDLKDAEKVGK